MLNRLYVKNYALIRELELKFDDGFTIITGETGAGKSIILGALGLVLGNRADSAALLDKGDKCVVEGSFRLSNGLLKKFFEDNDLDWDEHTIMRREIAVNGRSRAFINDTPVTLELMKDIGSHLIDIHSQHQTLMLAGNSFQLAILDSFAGHSALMESYSRTYREYRALEKEYMALKEEVEREKADFEYYDHQLAKLDEARLNPGEEKELEAERDLLEHSGEVHDAVESSAAIISNDDNSVIHYLNEARRVLEKITEYLPDANGYIERLGAVIVELNDLANELESKSGSFDADPGRLDFLNSRLDTIFSLLQRHRVGSVAELVEIRESLRKRISDITLGDDRLIEIESQLTKLKEQVHSSGKELSANRSETIGGVEQKMAELLSALGMPNGRFRVELRRLADYGPTGIDHADFLFSANRQASPENLGKVASGGELSRVMLSLKSLLTDNRSLPTIFFDEIDAGVSGEVATRVGQILTSMGKRMQVINITHLPQVAAFASKHYYVYKQDTENSTITHIKLLDKGERLNEIARLLSGDTITEASIENAKDLMERVN